MSRDDVEMFEKRKRCRSSPYQQQPNIQYCLSWKAAETGTSPGSSYHFGMSRPHSVMLTSSKQIPLCHRNDSLNTTKSKLRSEASKNFMFSQRSLPGIDCWLKCTYSIGTHQCWSSKITFTSKKLKSEIKQPTCDKTPFHYFQEALQHACNVQHTCCSSAEALPPPRWSYIISIHHPSSQIIGVWRCWDPKDMTPARRASYT